MAQIKYNLGSVINDEALFNALNYEDITAQCSFNSKYFGGANSRMPKVYKNYNSIVIDWNMTVLKAVENPITGSINIPIDDNIQIIGSESRVDLSQGGRPVGLAVLLVVGTPNITTPGSMILSIGNLFTGKTTPGTDTLRGTSVFNFIRLKS